MNRFRPVVNNKEKENADEQIKSQRMHVTHTATGQELVSQMPGTRYQPSDRCKKLRVPIQKGIENIDNDVAKGAAVIDGGLSALGAERSSHRRPAIFAIGQGWRLHFAPAREKAPAWRFQHSSDRSLCRDNVRLIVHITYPRKIAGSRRLRIRLGWH